MPLAPPRDSTLYTYLVRSHDYLRALLDRLVEAMTSDAPAVVRELWSELDHGLLSHMETEERFVLPAFARVNRNEAIALLREHGALREQLMELGIAIDLHSASLPQVRGFADTLRRHAGREEDLLYGWADANLDRAYLRSIEARIDRVAPGAT